MIQPTLTRLVAHYYQDADDCDRGVDQVLTLTLDTAGVDPFLVVSTERWAMDTPEELLRLLDTFVADGTPLFEKPPPCPSD
jgi:hypothetical protein